MKNASMPVGFGLILAGFLLCWSAVGQTCYKYLPVEPIGQQTRNWCWAACLEMVIKFHHPSDTITQCALAKHYRQLRTGTVNHQLCCRTNCASCPTGTESSDAFDQTIQFMREASFHGSPSTNRPAAYFNLIFSKLGYTAMEDINWASRPITWEQVKQEINACRPFILLTATIEPLESGNVPLTAHALVVKGYYESGDTRLLIVNDPWGTPCSGTEFALPYQVFQFERSATPVTGLPRYIIPGVATVVRNIRPNEQDCDSCDPLRHHSPVALHRIPGIPE